MKAHTFFSNKKKFWNSCFFEDFYFEKKAFHYQKDKNSFRMKLSVVPIMQTIL
ncbi:predicted protein [Enterococcus faecium 1,231,408]|nr:predicted protein [Enterococcus faecium 1,231,408]